MSEKGKDTLIIILILVIIALTCTICYVVIKKNFGGVTPAVENSGEVNNNSNTNENSITKEEVEKLVDKYYGGFDGKYFLIEALEKMDDYKNAFAYYNSKDVHTIELSSKVNVIDMHKLMGCFTDIDDFLETHPTSYEISYNSLNNSYKELFGSDTNASKEFVTLANGYVNYFNETDSYISGIACSGMGGSGPSYYTIGDFNNENNKLNVIVNVIELAPLYCYSNNNVMECEISYENPVKIDSDPTHTYGISYAGKSYALTDEQVNKDYIVSNYSDMISKKFKLTFEKKNGNYILVSSKEA